MHLSLKVICKTLSTLPSKWVLGKDYTKLNFITNGTYVFNLHVCMYVRILYLYTAITSFICFCLCKYAITKAFKVNMYVVIRGEMHDKIDKQNMY